MSRMNNTESLQFLLTDIESDHVERTISTTNTDKFGQAICAFANDLPDHREVGYLLIGVKDDGTPSGLKATDDLLKNIAAIRTDGNIQPQPSMTVKKVSLPEGDIIVVEVQPASFPPVKYKGRIWVRIGPRKGIANEDDERRLFEKRRINVTSFDAEPCINATINDLNLQLFRHYYLPKAMTDDVITEDNRDVRYQLSSLGFFDTRYDCPTNAGMLFFGKNLRRFLPGAYIQYVRFAGEDRTGEILNEHEFKDNLCTILPQLDTFIKTAVTNRRPIPVSTLREETVYDYPEWAIRELVMNAVCHRDYTSNGPIQFYQYDDRIEILNHGGLYGRANEQNFPYVNDYRNLVVAEGMKVLGFVNRQSRGILKVQKDLVANENGEAKYDFGLVTSILVQVKKSIIGDKLMEEAIAEGLVIDKIGQKRTKTDKNGQPIDKKTNVFPSAFIKTVYETIKSNPKAKYSWLEDNLGVNERTIRRAVEELKKLGYINPEHSKMGGEWQLLK